MARAIPRLIDIGSWLATPQTRRNVEWMSLIDIAMNLIGTGSWLAMPQTRCNVEWITLMAIHRSISLNLSD